MQKNLDDVVPIDVELAARETAFYSGALHAGRRRRVRVAVADVLPWDTPATQEYYPAAATSRRYPPPQPRPQASPPAEWIDPPETKPPETHGQKLARAMRDAEEYAARINNRIETNPDFIRFVAMMKAQGYDVG